jgi:hypothetical protein
MGDCHFSYIKIYEKKTLALEGAEFLILLLILFFNIHFGSTNDNL